MGLKDYARKATAIAAATTGLSSCKNGGGIGAVDPPPPPLTCNTVSNGQQMVARATRSGDTVSVVMTDNSLAAEGWFVDRVTDVTGATVSSVRLPANRIDSLQLQLRVAPGVTEVRFTVEARLTTGVTVCQVRRTFTITLQGTGVTIARVPDELPLEARQRGDIVVLAREGNRLQLEARSTWVGPRQASWEVTGGALDAVTGERVWWTLPDEPGVYQAELAWDYGPAGMAFDVFAIEVA